MKPLLKTSITNSVRSFQRLVGELAIVAFISCGVTPCSLAQYHEITVRDGGSVAGRVQLAVNSPAVERLMVTKDNDVCGVQPSLSRLMIGRNNGVQFAVISIEGISEGKKFAGGTSALLSQKGCEFQPHVMISGRTTPLEVVNNDRVLHNVHAYDVTSSPATIFNIAQPIKGQKSKIEASQFRDAGIVMITCDAGHPWMNAYIVRTDHPYYAVTDADGNFRIDGIPPGTYSVSMWHEGVTVKGRALEKGKATKYAFEEPYTQAQQVTVPPRGSSRADFVLKLR